MISPDDIRAAVGAGIVNEAQAASLKALSDSRRGARENLNAGDEPFELFKGFNEIFIVVGLMILASGWVTLHTFSVVTETANYRSHIGMVTGIGAIFVWLISEYFIRRRRMVAPAIALSIMFAANSMIGFAAYFAQPIMLVQQDYSSLPTAMMLGIGALAVYWWRFRVPFAMALMALGLFAVALVIGADSAGVPTDVNDLFLLSSKGPLAWITLLVGVFIFAVAMYFDMSDPHRVTRRSAQGFWLHVVAAPALVNTIALTLLETDSHIALTLVLALFSLTAIIIDRRSFLITAIGYIVTLAMTVFGGEGAGLTVFLLGIFLVSLGAFWMPIRAAILATLSGLLPLGKLPPSK